MQLARIVIQNFRSLKSVDVTVSQKSTCVVGENNTGKSNLIHALRLCLDANLSSTYRKLLKEDIHCDVDQGQPFQAFVGVEFTDFEGSDNEEAMLHGTQIGDGKARIFYRFRPRRAAREAIENQEREPTSLTLEDYSWEISGGGDPAVSLTDITWDVENDEIGASSVHFQHLQSYLVFYLHALRDVESDLQQLRRSPLALLINATNIDQNEQEVLVAAIKAANGKIEASPTVKTISKSIDGAFKEVTGPAFSLDVDLGLSAPTFQAIVRNLNVLLSSAAIEKFEPRRNGLGLNNILYISILIEYFRKRAANGKSSGELILIEEPEAHLHPQLQLTLLEALRSLPFQSIVTTHSTQVTSKAPLASFIMLTNKGGSAPFASAMIDNSALEDTDIDDLERYLDATKSNLLFARKVMLVEGPAEVFLIPPLVKKIMDVDLDREGISVVAIHGTHFAAFARLFCEEGLPKRCAIVADADQDPLAAVAEDDDDDPAASNLNALAGPYVKVFLGATTFERELTLDGNVMMLANAARELGAPRIVDKLELAEAIGVDEDLKAGVLRTANRFGKARFAQLAARHVAHATALPAYIRDAVDWLLAE